MATPWWVAESVRASRSSLVVSSTGAPSRAARRTTAPRRSSDWAETAMKTRVMGTEA